MSIIININNKSTIYDLNNSNIFRDMNNFIKSYYEMILFYTFAHLKRRINNEKNKQKCKNLVIIRLETDMNFKNLFLYKIFLVFFLFLEPI